MPTTRDVILFRTAQEVDSAKVAGRVAVVIDVLRATTTIAAAIAAGAARILPCRSPEEARRLRDGYADGVVLLGGERGGVKIDGFDLGNSPLSYTPGTVGGKTIIITTTNGTEAMGRSERAAKLVAASFVNAATVADWLVGEDAPLAFVCAGTEGKPSPEDELCAGLLIDRLEKRDLSLVLSAEAAAAVALWRGVSSLDEALNACYHARHLIELGFHDDVRYAARLDSLASLPLRDKGALTQGLR